MLFYFSLIGVWYYSFMKIWRGTRAGIISDYQYRSFRGQNLKTCGQWETYMPLIVILFIKITVSFIMHTYWIQRFSTSIQLTEYKIRCPKIDITFNSVLQNNNLPGCFQDEVKIRNGCKTTITLSKKICSIYGHIYHPAPWDHDFHNLTS